MKDNKGKYRVLLSTDQKVQVNMGTARIDNSKYEKLLVVKNDCKLILNDYIGNICKRLVQY